MTTQPLTTSALGASQPSTLNKTTTKGFNDLSSEDFFGLLIAQLQSQDPLKPTDNQTLMTQMSTIRQMEMSSQLNKTLTGLSSEQRFGATSSLIGHYVVGSVTDSGGNAVTVQGVVTGVSFDKSGNATLQLQNGAHLPADKVTEVTLVQNLPSDVQQQLAVQNAASKLTLAFGGGSKQAVSTAHNKQSPAASALEALVGAL